MLKNLFNKYREIIAYLFWGVMTTLVNWLCFILFSKLFESSGEWIVTFFGREFSMTILIVNSLSWAAAVLFAFVVNKIWVFGSKSWDKKTAWPEFLRFFSARVVTGIFEILAVPALVALGMNGALFGTEGMMAKVVVSVFVVIMNYVFSKLFVFKKPDSN